MKKKVRVVRINRGGRGVGCLGLIQTPQLLGHVSVLDQDGEVGRIGLKVSLIGGCGRTPVAGVARCIAFIPEPIVRRGRGGAGRRQAQA
ncbi:hypothetical protein [Brevundimonas sp.]|uniref:hypothetical protein n=1 Tax=Brevundimonas sp. TaxID=1871086 RepID=UPI001A335ADA|nr:hypothetical protein [Brevundimonas sp.]MBJ7485094.1 hypothetical protein [Brevundimonas sp.]